ncbi:hypothetical protein [Micromonospora sp. DT47]|uniref:hypothetical protein n=1 Tax=Micromonospora sp. DT47 TaxID=3393431 RepID=UPI003CFA50B7
MPVTFNTANKWATGASDTLALGILNEALGAGLPIHAFRHVKPALAAHPAYAGHLRLLEDAGVTIVPLRTQQGTEVGDRRRRAPALASLVRLKPAVG